MLACQDKGKLGAMQSADAAVKGQWGRRRRRLPGLHSRMARPALLSSPRAVKQEEVLALRELYLRLSNELHRDNLIHRDEFMWALFKANRDNLFAERVGSVFFFFFGRCAAAGEPLVAG